MAKKKNKIFVLDTNVILHNYRAIYAFRENDIVIPITVLEELDKFKKGDNELSWSARQFTRELDAIAGDKLFTDGVELGEGLGKLYVKTHAEYPAIVKNAFAEQIPDHRILATAQIVKEKNKDVQVILVTKDINLRMKAKSIGVVAEDFENDKLQDLDTIEEGVRVIQNVDSALISKMYGKTGELIVTPEEVGIEHPKSHEYFILKSDKSSIIAYYNANEKIITRVVKRQVFGIEPRNAEQTFALHALTNKDIRLIAITGKAGTGKTLVALAAALEQHEHYEQILLARPIVALGNKDLGYLPGGEKDKIRPYMLPLFDNIQVIKQNLHRNGEQVSLIDNMLKDGRLEISPLAYIRGRSLPKVFFIIDEAQNLTPHEVKTIITRAGEGTKIIFTGDIQQIDSPYLDSFSNGLSVLSTKMKGQKLFTHINLVRGERSELAELASTLL
ncbi:MAG TPA: PhoH family protein [Bacteroidales bacterium]|nr:MAG: PhoH-like protein [Bacteroidetes bacterium ADurb.Bin217]HPM12183.1 PhoH family protein [Bacteroidales bacterium]